LQSLQQCIRTAVQVAPKFTEQEKLSQRAVVSFAVTASEQQHCQWGLNMHADKAEFWRHIGGGTGVTTQLQHSNVFSVNEQLHLSELQHATVARWSCKNTQITVRSCASHAW
jgi:hypothetical protein